MRGSHGDGLVQKAAPRDPSIETEANEKGDRLLAEKKAGSVEVAPVDDSIK